MKTRATDRWHGGLRDLVRDGVPLIDLRSPAEHERGAIPGSRNIPLFDDAERHLVGLTYKTEGQKPAVALGLELFAAKAERFLAEITELAPEGKVALHCWRGGMRSGSVAFWLRSMGFEVRTLAGGYKAYRNEVLAAIEQLAQHELVVLDGRTGVGKTELVRRLGEDGPQIDFEGFAAHRGSAFGDFAQPRPVATQQNFENELVERYWDVRHWPKLVVEIEDVLGPVKLSKALRGKIFSSPIVLLERDFDDRAERLAAEYAAGWDERSDALFRERIELLSRYLSGEEKEKICDAVARRDFREAAALLLKCRYDKVYDKGIAKRQRQIIARFNLSRAGEEEEALRFLRALAARA